MSTRICRTLPSGEASPLPRRGWFRRNRVRPALSSGEGAGFSRRVRPSSGLITFGHLPPRGKAIKKLPHYCDSLYQLPE